MVALYKDPQGKKVFSGDNQSDIKNSTDRRRKSDAAIDNAVAALTKRVYELENMMTQSHMQVYIPFRNLMLCIPQICKICETQGTEGGIANHIVFRD